MEVAVVKWLDHWSRSDALSEKELLEHKRLTRTTVGFVLYEDKDTLVLSGTYHQFPFETEVQYAESNFLEKKLIVSDERYELD